MTFISYAQNFEDVVLMRTFAGVERGLYIDIGAQDPTVDSVSRAFHERGWRGVHVEPNGEYAAMLRRERPGDVVIEAAVTERPSIVTFYEIPGSGISTVCADIAQRHRERGVWIVERQIPSITLATVLEQCADQTVHWLKLDIEGSERSALASWGDCAIRPQVVVVESTLPMTPIPSHEEWEPLLLEKGYAFAYFDGLNRFYVSKASLELKARLAVPPNVFDDFEFHGSSSAPFHRTLLRKQQEQAQAFEQNAAALRAQAEADKSVLEAHLLEARTRVDVEVHERVASEHTLRAEIQAEANAKAEELRELLERQRAREHMQTDRLQEAQVHAQQYADRVIHLAECLGTLEIDRNTARAELASLRLEATARGVRVQAEHEAAREIIERLTQSERQQGEQVRALSDQLVRASALALQHADGAQRMKEELAVARAEAARFRAAAQQREQALRQAHEQAIVALRREAKAHADRAESHTRALADAEACLRESQRDAIDLAAQRENDVGAFEPMEAARVEGASDPMPARWTINSHYGDTPLNTPDPVLHVHQIIMLEGAAFVATAYRAVLGREPDPEGETYYRKRLDEGNDPEQILVELANSDEGKSRALSLPGLAELVAARRPSKRWLSRLQQRLMRIDIKSTRAESALWNLRHDVNLNAQWMQAQLTRLAEDSRRSSALVEARLKAIELRSNATHDALMTSTSALAKSQAHAAAMHGELANSLDVLVEVTRKLTAVMHASAVPREAAPGFQALDCELSSESGAGALFESMKRQVSRSAQAHALATK